MAGKNSLRYDHPLNLGAIGVTGTLAANWIARDADLVIGIGTQERDSGKYTIKNLASGAETTLTADRIAEHLFSSLG